MLGPFLILVCLVVIVVLVVQLIMGMRSQTIEDKKNQAFLFLERGTAEFHPWGQEEWYDAFNKALIREGDTIRTAPNAYAVLEFYDGSRIRMNESTEVLLEKLEAGRKGIDVEVRLLAGEVWVNELVSEHGLQFRLFTPHINVVSVGTSYGVAVAEEEFVRVVRGEVRASIQDTLIENSELLDAVSIGIGQQVSVSEQDIDDLEARKFVNLLESVDDYWRVTEWYLWNLGEDDNPTQYVDEEEETTPEEASEEREDVIEGETEDDGTEEVEVPLPEIAVTNPAETPFDLEDTQIFLKGTVSDDVTKVVVTEFHKDPKGVPYELTKFVPSSGIWNYSAGLEFGNLLPGKNRFVIQAFNSDGLVSDPVEVVINVPEDAEVEAKEEVIEEEIIEKPVVVEPVKEEPSEPVEPVIVLKPIGETQPTITSAENADVVGPNAFLTTEKRVVVHGLTGGADDVQRVVVNGWPLSLYEPGSRTWTYFAKITIGSLQPGDNTYNVYTENSKGERSLSATFTIRKE